MYRYYTLYCARCQLLIICNLLDIEIIVLYPVDMKRPVGRPIKENKKVSLHVSVPSKTAEIVRDIISRYPHAFSSTSNLVSKSLFLFFKIFAMAVKAKVTPEVMLDRLMRDYLEAEGE